VLDPVALDERQRPAYRAEALSLIAAQQAIAGNPSSIGAVATIEKLLPGVDFDARRARILHHLGIVSRHTGDVDRAFERLAQSTELASELHFYSVASRTYAVLSNLSLHEEDDVGAQLFYAERAADTAMKAGDVFALRTALLQMLSAQMRNADLQQSLAIERRLATLHTDALVRRYTALFKAMRLGWDARFHEASGLLTGCLKELTPGVDWATSGAQRAVFLALDAQREASVNQVNDILSHLPSIRAKGRFDIRAIVISQVFCAIAELTNGRPTNADRILRRLTPHDVVESAAVRIARCMLRTRSSGAVDWKEVTEAIEHLGRLGYCDVARLLEAVVQELRRRYEMAEAPTILTASECKVLARLAHGLVPKEIAEESKRSVHTVRAHIANALGKLGCHGQAEAIRVARQRGLI
jgi:DNA-binding CsgD family transcriptional regulator